jgi:hypothetical protein
MINKMESRSIRGMFKKVSKAKKQAGFIGLIKRSLAFLSNKLFAYQRYYIYENTFGGPEFGSKVENPVLKIIKNIDEVDTLRDQGYDLTYFDSERIRLILDKGSVGFFVFVEKELAHITWVALNDESKKLIDPVPFNVDYKKGEVCSGGSETNPKFARKHIFLYVYSQIFDYLKKVGKRRDIFSISKTNVASNNALMKFDSKIIHEGLFIKFLFWTYWKTTKSDGEK